VAVASKFLAAGAVVPAARAGLGAIATQSFVNLRYIPTGFELLEQGLSAGEVLATMTGADDKREARQVGLVGAQGGGAAFTGSECISWAGHRTGPGYAAQGNCLAGPEVVEAMERAFLADPDAPLARRLLAGLTAGDEAGGDRRGRQSAALLVVSPGGGYDGGSDVLVDLRIDDHTAPVGELGRLLGLHELYFGKPDPATLLPLTGEVADEVRTRLGALGYAGDASGADLDELLFDWMGWENYEERHVPGSIDPVVLAALREADS
jgi:uncharacterized Ntn-hydrolase superfamily protein